MKPTSEARIAKNKHAEKDTDKLAEISTRKDVKGEVGVHICTGTLKHQEEDIKVLVETPVTTQTQELPSRSISRDRKSRERRVSRGFESRHRSESMESIASYQRSKSRQRSKCRSESRDRNEGRQRSRSEESDKSEGEQRSRNKRVEVQKSNSDRETRRGRPR